MVSLSLVVRLYRAINWLENEMRKVRPSIFEKKVLSCMVLYLVCWFFLEWQIFFKHNIQIWMKCEKLCFSSLVSLKIGEQAQADKLQKRKFRIFHSKRLPYLLGWEQKTKFFKRTKNHPFWLLLLLPSCASDVLQVIICIFWMSPFLFYKIFSEKVTQNK